MKDPRQVIQRPLITEKSTIERELHNAESRIVTEEAALEDAWARFGPLPKGPFNMRLTKVEYFALSAQLFDRELVVMLNSDRFLFLVEDLFEWVGGLFVFRF